MNSQTFAKVLIVALIAFAPASSWAQEPASEQGAEETSTEQAETTEQADDSVSSPDAEDDDAEAESTGDAAGRTTAR